MVGTSKLQRFTFLSVAKETLAQMFSRKFYEIFS